MTSDKPQQKRHDACTASNGNLYWSWFQCAQEESGIEVWYFKCADSKQYVCVCVCGLSYFWSLSTSWKDDMLRLNVSACMCVDSRVREDFLLGNHSWNERQCREWWNSFMQGARRSWFLVCWSCWSHLTDVMCMESIGMNKGILCAGPDQPLDKCKMGCTHSATTRSVKSNKSRDTKSGKRTANPPTVELHTYCKDHWIELKQRNGRRQTACETEREIERKRESEGAVASPPHMVPGL